ncbi:hypothetical protein [Litorilituus sediminis]|uniref:Uncharacterized protein n=1 Tax=Litorilituus sediminis TaxID=718192 RepID=A0A4P6PAI2_9GAMM|nr:hypothetical protein [Litorilituus sediminis]QBG37329.1 hypothetical protein EMK97_17085 [Litorilituus sediminis]
MDVKSYMHHLLHLTIYLVLMVLYLLYDSAGRSDANILEGIIVGTMSFAPWHALWAVASIAFKASRPVVNGAYLALHLFWCFICLQVVTSIARDSMNLWFIYIVFAPIAIFLGAFIGKKLFKNSIQP